jgi:hypothetical protein
MVLSQMNHTTGETGQDAEGGPTVRGRFLTLLVSGRANPTDQAEGTLVEGRHKRARQFK